jgi:hypothetical protein
VKTVSLSGPVLWVQTMPKSVQQEHIGNINGIANMMTIQGKTEDFLTGKVKVFILSSLFQQSFTLYFSLGTRDSHLTGVKNPNRKPPMSSMNLNLFAWPSPKPLASPEAAAATDLTKRRSVCGSERDSPDSSRKDFSQFIYSLLVRWGHLSLRIVVLFPEWEISSMIFFVTLFLLGHLLQYIFLISVAFL